MRRSTCCLLVVLFGSWSSSLGQSAPKLTYPKIVATFHRFGLTAELPPTTIYTPKNWGTFRISIVMVGTVANGQINPIGKEDCGLQMEPERTLRFIRATRFCLQIFG